MGQQSSKTKPSLRTDIIRESSKSLRRERIASSVGTPTRRQANGLNNHQKSRNNTYDPKKNRLDSQIINHDKRSTTLNSRHVQNTISSRTQNSTSTTVASAKERAAKESTGINENHNSHPVTTVPDVVNNRDQCIQTLVTLADVAKQRDHEVTIQAFAITIQYLSSQVDKSELMVKNEREEHQRDIDRLHEELEAQYVERIEFLEAALRDEKREVTRLQGALAESAKEHRLAMTRLQTEHANEIARRDDFVLTERQSCISDAAALVAEAESLRSVLELKNEEVSALRAENDVLRRQLEAKEVLEQRVMTLEARCEDLKEQLNTKETNERSLSQENELLLESYHHMSKLNERHHQRIEELEWKLKHKNKSKSFTNQYSSVNHSLPVNNTLSRSYNADRGNAVTHDSWQSVNSDSQTPMVKYVIEKGDSVSWTLEMDEYPERHLSSNHISSNSSVTSVSRQSSLRLPNSRHNSFEPIRSRSTSFSETSPRNDVNNWVAPSASSTPKNRRKSNSRTKSTADTSINVPLITIASVDEEVHSGPRPQEAGGEAMISEEASASSSEDESSASSDIHAISQNKLSWRKTATADQ